MIELPEGICYSPYSPKDYLPTVDADKLFFSKYAEDLPTWNMMWLTQPALDAGIDPKLDRTKWYKWTDITQALDAGLIGKMTASLKLDAENVPPGMALRHLLTLQPLDFLKRLKQREWWDISMFEDPAVMDTIESRAHLSAGVEYAPQVEIALALAASTAKESITAVEGNVVYARFGKREAG